jgi:glutaredoxin
MTEVVVHCKPGCKYCDLAEDFLKSIFVPYTKVKYCPADPDYAERRDCLFGVNSHNSFPHIMVGRTFVGGYAELKRAYESSLLEEMLKGVGMELIDF